MKNLIVFQHVAHEILGTLHPLLRDAGFRMKHVNFGRDPETRVEMDRYDGLVVLGGPQGVYEQDTHAHLTHEIECIQRAIAGGKPVLGICLGAQLIAAALGAAVRPHGVTEIGWYDVSLTEEGKHDPVLGQCGPTERIFQWHGDTYELPKGAVQLARSEACAQQAFRYGERVYGFQFHLEVDEAMIQRWLQIPAMRAQAEGLEPKGAVGRIEAETQTRIAHLKQLSQRVFSKYIDLFSTKSRTTVLGSGHK